MDFLQIKKEDNHPEWTVLTVDTDNYRNTLPAGHTPPTAALTLIAEQDSSTKLKKLKPDEIASNLTVAPGLKIPRVQWREPNLHCRMYREHDPNPQQDVMVRVKCVESPHGMPVWCTRVLVSLLEYDEREAVITFPPALSHRRVASFIQSVRHPNPPTQASTVPSKISALRCRTNGASRASSASAACRAAGSRSPISACPPPTPARPRTASTGQRLPTGDAPPFPRPRFRACLLGGCAGAS